MKYELLIAFLLIPIGCGVICTRLWNKHRERNVIAQRLARLKQAASADTKISTNLLQQNLQRHALSIPKQRTLKGDDGNNSMRLGQILNMLLGFVGINILFDILRNRLVTIGRQELLPIFAILTVASLPLSLTFALVFGLNIWIAGFVGTIGSAAPLIYLQAKAQARRTKFLEQLPDAIDLMIAVLRSGHGVSQAVKAVSQEIPDPCGNEYAAVLQRMNLGQPLAQSLIPSASRYRAYELELIRRAVAIQSEIGGSLAELLEKTNYTLRQRLKLSRQLKVITAQSRLSALIVGILPIILAVMLHFASPGYLQLLMEDKMGRMLLSVAVVLELFGLIVMKQMSTIKI